MGMVQDLGAHKEEQQQLRRRMEGRQWMTEWDSVGWLVLPGPWLTAAPPPYLANYKVLCPQPFR